jgi:hypothetical protein
MDRLAASGYDWDTFKKVVVEHQSPDYDDMRELFLGGGGLSVHMVKLDRFLKDPARVAKADLQELGMELP